MAAGFWWYPLCPCVNMAAVLQELHSKGHSMHACCVTLCQEPMIRPYFVFEFSPPAMSDMVYIAGFQCREAKPSMLI
ncbi:unnamed protein product [Boreogadus saida]